MTNNKANFWENKLYDFWRYVWYAGQELADGICHNRINLAKFVYPGILVAILLLLRVDSAISFVTGIDGISLPIITREWLTYISLFSGWIIWAVIRAHYRATYFERLKKAFTDSNLRAHGKLPFFIEDQAVDNHVRRLKVKVDGITVKAFQEAREKLEANFNCSIVRICEDGGDKSRINIYYATEPLPTEAIMLDNVEFGSGEFPIGVSYEGPITANLRDLPHMLVAGTSGGGKSNFEKVVTTALVLNNPDADVVFVDFKGGSEVASLINRLGEEHVNFAVYKDHVPCAEYLAHLGAQIDLRFKEIARVGASHIDEYLKKRDLEIQNDLSREVVTNKDAPPKRLYLIIDEIAELYSKAPKIPKDVLFAARAAVNRIARQGRSAGIHMIAAVQTPDVTSFDQTLKANMPAVVCFPMMSVAGSVSALGTKRAVEIDPAIKGRAIWKYGPKMLEVQTYLFQ